MNFIFQIKATQEENYFGEQSRIPGRIIYPSGKR